MNLYREGFISWKEKQAFLTRDASSLHNLTDSAKFGARISTRVSFADWGWGWGEGWKKWNCGVGVWCTVLKTLTLFQNKIYYFPSPFSDLTSK